SGSATAAFGAGVCSAGALATCIAVAAAPAAKAAAPATRKIAFFITPLTATPFASAATAADGDPEAAVRTLSTRRDGDALAGAVAARAKRPVPSAQPRLVRAAPSRLRPRSSWVLSV